MKRAVIFSGGAFEKPDWVTLPKDAMILCADSGLRHARALGISPDWVLGDFDSSSEQPEGESVLRYPPEKDDTDAMLAVKQALSLGAEEIQIYGGLGGLTMPSQTCRRCGICLSMGQLVRSAMHRTG